MALQPTIKISNVRFIEKPNELKILQFVWYKRALRKPKTKFMGLADYIKFIEYKNSMV